MILLLVASMMTSLGAQGQYYLNNTYAHFPTYTNEPVSYSWNNGNSFKGTKFLVDGVVQSYNGTYKWSHGSYYTGPLDQNFEFHGMGTYYDATTKKFYNVSYNRGNLVSKKEQTPTYTGGSGYYGGGSGYSGGGSYNSGSSSSSKTTCMGCHGTGTCQHCHGSGLSASGKSKCSLCGGRTRCVSCGGKGWVR